MKFNEKFKFLREKRGYTQEEIAHKLNISRQSISKYENGINEPDIETIKKLCNILDCSLNELLDDNHELITSKLKKINKREKKLFCWNIALFIYAILVCFSFLRGMSDQVIIHWDSKWNPTYGSKWNHLVSLLCNLIGLIIAIICKYGLGKYKKYYEEDKDKIQLAGLIIQILGIVMIIVFMSLSDTFNYPSLALIIFNLMYSCIIPIAIFAHPFFNKRNPFFGLKTTLTLSSDEAWNKANAFMSFAMGISGILSFAIYLVLFDIGELLFLFMTIPTIVAIIVSMIYYSILKNKMNN